MPLAPDRQATATVPPPPLHVGSFGRHGHDLSRPECVLATASEKLFISDKRGGIQRIDSDGSQYLSGTSNLIPNGIALQPTGDFLVANMGEDGGVWHIDAKGQARPWLMEFEGRRLPKVNYVTTDRKGRTWICVSATETGDLYPVDSASGFILMHDARGIRCATDGIRYTNEVRVSQDGRHLYVNETFGRCLTRFQIAADDSLSSRETVTRFEAGDFPDGMALDAQGGVWVVCIGSNRVYRVLPDGSRQLMIDDADPACVLRLETAFASRTLTRPMLVGARGRQLSALTSLAFAGPDMRTAYMGSLDADALVTFHSPVPGLRPDHWLWA